MMRTVLPALRERFRTLTVEAGGIDRLLGYGLKLRNRFTETYLGEIGQARKASTSPPAPTRRAGPHHSA